MTPAKIHPTIEETLRAREVYRYYQPYNSLETLDLSDSSSSQTTDFATSQFLLDTALTAFAKLIAARFDAQRAIISLTDSKYEYFLAESTSSLNPVDTDCYAQNHFLSGSGSKVPRNASLCEQTLLELTPSQVISTSPACIVPDLRLNDKLRELSCVNGAPYLRFYYGVALTNNKGIKIGSIYVVDSTVRNAVSFEQKQFLGVMAETVMGYLENIRVKEEVSRVTRMSQGLHAFVEGAGTMHGNWRRLGSYDLPGGAGIGYRWKSDGFGATETILERSRSLAQGKHVDEVVDEVVDEQEPPPSTMVDYFSKQPRGGLAYSLDALSNLLRSTFSRASNLIREGMQVDGAVFFDAPVGVKLDDSLFESGSSSSADEEYADIRSNPLSKDMHQSACPPIANDHLGGLGNYETAPLECNILGFSTHKHSSLKGEKKDDTDAFFVMDRNLLVSLVRQYPEGKLFAFDHHGTTAHHGKIAAPSPRNATASMKHKRDRHKARKKAEIGHLLTAFPGARQIFFIPLYDSVSEYFIGSFTWSTSDTRIFSTENDLSYLIAFSHSVMTEVGRLNMLSADRAKDQFINNVSHELRSPLHGILASAEFLAETSMNGFQRSLVDNVDGCGRTLLDTIEHILDFSKIKKFGKDTKQSLDIIAEVDISSIVEEALEGIYAGFEIHNLSSHNSGIMKGSGTGNASNTKEDVRVWKSLQRSARSDLPTVILDIDFREQWRFSTTPGTWRCVMMNIFGNALKYTSTGWIKVKLEAAKIIPTDLVEKDARERTTVTLTISDSGKGISDDFMKTKLFVPFCQEDVTTPGTGLGMSIVKQVVGMAGGTIDVHSELGKGTQVRVSLPLEKRLDQSADNIVITISPSEALENPILAVRRRARGRTVILQGFESQYGATHLKSQSLASLKASIEKYIREWFDLRLVSAESLNDVAADIVICDESAFQDSASLTGNKISRQGQLLLILCSNGTKYSLYTATIDRDRIFEFVNKPCGPNRLAKALQRCLDKEVIESADGKKASPSDSDSDPKCIASTPPSSSHRSDSENTTSSSSFTKTSKKLSAKPSSIEISMVGSLPLARRKMLLVEDNPVNMMLLSTYMRKNNWDFEKAENGLVALQMFENRLQGFDVIFMDISMPIMTGHESTQGIRKVEMARRKMGGMNRRALIIALTGFTSAKDQDMAFDSGVDIFMTKPVKFKEVGRILEGWMR